MAAPDPITQAVRDLCNALNDAAFGPDPGPHYLIIAPKFFLAAAGGLTYEVDSRDGMIVITPVGPPDGP